MRGNTIIGIGGFLLASNGAVDPVRLIATTLGLAGIIASACVVNNLIDRRIDAKMERTKKRALVSGTVSRLHAVTYAAVLGTFGVALLYVYTTNVAVLLAVLAYYFYVVVYGLWKRNSVHGTLVGTISGALPPVIGYAAVTGKIDVTAALIFLAMVFWQMTHFYSIAIFRLKDYKSAGIPVMPAVRGIATTKNQMLIYGALFIATITAMSVFGNTGYLFALILGMLGFIWLVRGVLGYNSQNDTAWAGGMFGFSITVLLTFGLLMALNPYLP